MNTSSNVRKLTGLSILTAIIVLLTVMGSFISFGPFAISLCLAPIIIGAALYGPLCGGYLGGAFGVVVLITCIIGRDIGGSMMWNASPLYTALLCIIKGAVAGLVAGWVFHLIAKKNSVAAAIVAGVVAPICNTGIFIFGLVFCFYDILTAWAGGTDIIYYIITGLVGVNFVLELIINLVLSNVIVRVVRAREKIG